MTSPHCREEECSAGKGEKDETKKRGHLGERGLASRGVHARREACGVFAFAWFSHSRNSLLWFPSDAWLCDVAEVPGTVLNCCLGRCCCCCTSVAGSTSSWCCVKGAARLPAVLAALSGCDVVSGCSLHLLPASPRRAPLSAIRRPPLLTHFSVLVVAALLPGSAGELAGGGHAAGGAGDASHLQGFTRALPRAVRSLVDSRAGWRDEGQGRETRRLLPAAAAAA